MSSIDHFVEFALKGLRKLSVLSERKFTYIIACTSQEDVDLPYEEEILRHPFSVKCWMRYIEHKVASGGKRHSVNILYERALKELPGRYNTTFFDFFSFKAHRQG